MGFGVVFGVIFQRDTENSFLTNVCHVQDNSASGKEGKMTDYCNQHTVGYCTANSGFFSSVFFLTKATNTHPFHTHPTALSYINH